MKKSIGLLAALVASALLAPTAFAQDEKAALVPCNGAKVTISFTSPVKR